MNLCNSCSGKLTLFNGNLDKLKKHLYWTNYFKKNTLNINDLTNTKARLKYKQLKALKVKNIRFSYNCDFCGKFCEVNSLTLQDTNNRKKFIKFCKGHSIAAGKVNNGYKVFMNLKKFLKKQGNNFINVNTISDKLKKLMITLPNKLWNINGTCDLCGKNFQYKNVRLYQHNLRPICQYHKDRFTKFGEKEYRKAYYLYNNHFLDNSKDNPMNLSKRNLDNARYILSTGFGTCHFYFKFRCLDCKEIKIKRFGPENINKNDYFDRCHYCTISKNNIKKYGYKSPQFQNPKNRKRNDEVKREKYGSASAVGNYKYKNELFNSSWELAFWIYHKDKNHPIKREPKAFDYCVGKSIHQYWPDFKVYNKYYEIKGDRFLVFDKNGKIIDFQTFERKRTKMASAKYKCLRDHHVRLITWKQIKKYLKYIKNTYGEDYLDKYKIKKD